MKEHMQSTSFKGVRGVSDAAFTLVELAIVIVIIGLLVGGVLAGQELVEQAKIRAQIKQLQEFDAATATFKSKYGFLPGDVPDTTADRFQLPRAVAAAFFVKGDGKIFSQNGWNEPYYFFIQLYAAKLIKDHLVLTAATYDVGVVFPRAKLNDGGVAAVTEPSGGLGYFIGPSAKHGGVASSSLWSVISNTPTLRTSQAWNMDLKLDDGNPQTGLVRTVEAANFLPQDTSTGGCHGAVNTEYNLTSEQLACRITVKSMIN